MIRPTKYNKLLRIAFIVSFITGWAGLILLLTVDWRIALGVFLVQYSLTLRKENRNYERFNI